MSELSERTRWWGWGAEGEGRPGLSERAGRALARELGIAPTTVRPSGGPALQDVVLPESRVVEELRRRLEGAVGEGGIRCDRLARVAHAAGKSYPDLVRMRAGRPAQAPDAVLYPGSPAEVAVLLAVCSEAGVAVVPFGGGTSVVGGVSPLRDGFEATVSLELARMADIAAVDARSLLVRAGPGLLGARAEAALGRRGLTLGHFPQSFELATLGGYAATRSAGQASTGFGRFDEMVLGLRCATPAGEISIPPVPSSAAGPSVRELLLGSEGTLGVITELQLAVRAEPEVRRYEGWSFRSFTEGVDAFRALAQAGAEPDIARLSDEEESRLSAALASSGSAAERAGRAYLRARGHDGGSIAILGWEGASREVARRRYRTGRMLRAAGGLALGEGPGRAWSRSRYAAPYLRDELMDMGAMVDTLETATSWSGLLELHRAVREAVEEALAARGARAVLGCHLSHLYTTGASLYFTVLAPAEPDAPIDQWGAMKRGAGVGMAAHGGTITHHHGVGTDHRPWMRAEVGEVGLDALRAAKNSLDPAGIMNPGKLLPVPPGPGGAAPD